MNSIYLKMLKVGFLDRAVPYTRLTAHVKLEREGCMTRMTIITRSSPATYLRLPQRLHCAYDYSGGEILWREVRASSYYSRKPNLKAQIIYKFLNFSTII